MKKYLIFALILVSSFVLQNCAKYDNFTAYFNTYYNMERITKECEEEFEYQDEKKRVLPRVFVPKPEFYINPDESFGVPPFLIEFIVNQQKRQPVEIKLDSIIEKGSKILAKKGKTKYVEGAIFLMAKSFFYQEDWMNSQIKCSELIDKFPDGDLSPDAHLMFSKNLLIQRKFLAGENMLSRTVDICWQKKRYDILAEAFRIQAELALYQNDMDKAVRPYLQAIAQSDDEAIRAKWQLDMAALLYRIGEFDRAEKAFRKVHSYSPDYLQRFEAYIYQASCLSRLKRYDEARKLLDNLMDDGKYEEWKAYTSATKLTLERCIINDSLTTKNWNNAELVCPSDSSMLANEKITDSTYVNNPLLVAHYFERGMDYYKKDDYLKARSYFAKSRIVKTPIIRTSDKLFNLLNNIDIKKKNSENLKKIISTGKVPNPDSLNLDLSNDYFEMGRIHEELNHPDSVVNYYQLASTTVPINNENYARYTYAWARVIKNSNPKLSDSLLDLVVQYHPKTEFGKDARIQLGYTDAFVIDTTAEYFKSGVDLMKTNDFNFAVRQFEKVYKIYPESKLAPKSLYTMGWIFEKKTFQYDSALYYYNILVEKYPNTDYAKDILLSYNYKNAVLSGQPIPDSLKSRPEVQIIQAGPIKPYIKELPAGLPQTNKKKPFDPMDIIKDPSKILSEPSRLLGDPIELLKDVPSLDSLSNPSKLLDKIGLPDSVLSDPSKLIKMNLPNLPSDSTQSKKPDTKKEK